jgi:serine/threonine-protein kinase RIO1
VGQSVDLRHPLSEKYLDRDIDNICRFFGKWVKANPQDIKARIKEDS